MKRLFAQTVARNQQLAPTLVPKREREHAAQFLYALSAQLFVQMNNYFCVGVGIEAMAAGFELGTQLRKVVDLAVEYDPDRAIFIEDWLVSAGNVDDAETPHSQPRILLRKQAFIVRPAMHDCLAHAMDGNLFDPLRPIRTYDSGDSAHG